MDAGSTRARGRCGGVARRGGVRTAASRRVSAIVRPSNKYEAVAGWSSMRLPIASPARSVQVTGISHPSVVRLIRTIKTASAASASALAAVSPAPPAIR